jgi:hypothetical protein
MSTNYDGGPAFPIPSDEHLGMSLRDYFAAHASEEDIRSVMVFGEGFSDSSDRAAARLRFADLMLKAREA